MKHWIELSLIVGALTYVAGCSGLTQTTQQDQRGARLYEGMGGHGHKVTTSSARAQQYFDQGLVWTFAFNHDEAIRSYEEAARLDPDCAMAWWGIALCNGPHINNPIVTPKRSEAAWAALQRAVALKDKATPTEQALIDALSKRYADPAPADRRPLDEAYASAMHDVWLANRNDSDVGTLYAESLMDLRPWDLWQEDGQPQPGTAGIIAVLEEVMRLDENHPGANHLYIHTIEASPEPGRASVSADRLRNLVPGSGHLVHMPSHIDVLTGRWEQASKQNELAIEVDRDYRIKSPDQGFYRLYMVHNHHMLAFASMMEGRRETAIRAAHDVVNSVPADYLKRESALMDPYMGAIYDALKRFGLWDEILSEPAPPKYLKITTAMWRFSRALALAAKGEIVKAEQEKKLFLDAVSRIPDDAIFAINNARHVLKIAEHMLDGEIALARRDVNLSVYELRKAIVLEDDLMYMEPPEWVQPVRHTLGAVLLSAGRSEEAEIVYLKDLKKWPNNGWSLYGLSRCYRMRNDTKKAEEFEALFAKAWSRADTEIASSCKCVPKT